MLDLRDVEQISPAHISKAFQIQAPSAQAGSWPSLEHYDGGQESLSFAAAGLNTSRIKGIICFL